MPPRKRKKDVSLLHKAIVTLIILGSVAIFGNKKERTSPPLTQTAPPTKPATYDPLSPIPEPIRSVTKHGQEIIKNMGDENIRQTNAMHEEIQAAMKAKRPVNWQSLRWQNDMPPEDHPRKWSRMQIGNDYCWLHVKTLKKICD